MTSKQRNRVNKGRLRILAPIREVSGLVPVEVVPYGSRTVKVSDPIKPILVKSLPVQNDRTREQKVHHLPEYIPRPEDALVEEYLTQARHSNFIHSQYNFGNGFYHLSGSDGLLCSCCANRNRESLEKKAAIQSGKDFTSIRVQTPKESEKSVDQPQENQYLNYYQTMPYQRTPRAPDTGFWPNYPVDPNVHAYTRAYPYRYLSMYSDRLAKPFSKKHSAQRAYIQGRVVEANSKYHESMHKLQVHFEKNYSVPENSFILNDD